MKSAAKQTRAGGRGVCRFSRGVTGAQSGLPAFKLQLFVRAALFERPASSPGSSPAQMFSGSAPTAAPRAATLTFLTERPSAAPIAHNLVAAWFGSLRAGARGLGP